MSKALRFVKLSDVADPVLDELRSQCACQDTGATVYREPARQEADVFISECRRMGLASARELFQTFDNYEVYCDKQAEIVKAVLSFCETYGPGRWLALTGTVGTGKDHLATGIIKALASIGMTCWAGTAHETLRRYEALQERGWFNEYEKCGDNWINRINVLCLRDFGMVSDWKTDAFVAALVDNFYMNADRRTLIITTNLKPSEIAAKYSERVVDRLRELCGDRLLTCEWESYRKRNNTN